MVFYSSYSLDSAIKDVDKHKNELNNFKSELNNVGLYDMNWVGDDRDTFNNNFSYVYNDDSTLSNYIVALGNYIKYLQKIKCSYRNLRDSIMDKAKKLPQE